MTIARIFIYTVLLSAAVLFSPAGYAQGTKPPAVESILDVGAEGRQRLRPASEQVTIAPSRGPIASGITVTIGPGPEGYPGVTLRPDKAVWDLSRFGHVEARVVNTGDKPLSVLLRVDNAGDWADNPWNTESVSLPPGKSGTITAIFGYSLRTQAGLCAETRSRRGRDAVRREVGGGAVVPHRVPGGRRPGGGDAAGRAGGCPHQADRRPPAGRG